MDLAVDGYNENNCHEYHAGGTSVGSDDVCPP